MSFITIDYYLYTIAGMSRAYIFCRLASNQPTGGSAMVHIHTFRGQLIEVRKGQVFAYRANRGWYWFSTLGQYQELQHKIDMEHKANRRVSGYREVTK
jgi:hypothetical protein